MQRLSYQTGSNSSLGFITRNNYTKFPLSMTQFSHKQDLSSCIIMGLLLSFGRQPLYLLVSNCLSILMDTIITVASLLNHNISHHPHIQAGWLQLNTKRGRLCNVLMALLIIPKLNYIYALEYPLDLFIWHFILYPTLKSMKYLLSIPLIWFWSIASIYC